MKRDSNKNLMSELSQIKDQLELVTQPEARAAFEKDLDAVITALSRLRAGLMNPFLEAKVLEIRRPLEQVVTFLEFAKSDEVLRALLFPTRNAARARPKRQAVHIGANLTNEQIRTLLEGDLSKGELKAIAAQRGISVGKSTNDEIKRNILKNLQRQEGYGRLAAS